MAEASTTQLQASGYRFGLRRLERALLGEPGGDVIAAVAQPLRVRSALAVGGLLAVIAVGAGAVLAFAQPQPTLGTAPIVMGERSGALYVRVDQTLHPVLNLASARLIAASDADPQPVRDADLAAARRGPLLGIPGAPQSLGAAVADTLAWSVCDSPGPAGPTTTLIIGADRSEPARLLDPGSPVLVRAAGAESRSYLLYRGRRTVLDGAAGIARRVSGVLLDAIPEAPSTGKPPGLPAGSAAPDGSETLCVHWNRRPDGAADVILSVGVGLPLPTGTAPVVLAQADGAGPALDAIRLPPGNSAYVRSAGVSASAGGERYLVADTGVRFAIADDDAAASLGLRAAATPAPWPMLAGLPAGPQLSRQNALVARDVLPGPS